MNVLTVEVKSWLFKTARFLRMSLVNLVTIVEIELELQLTCKLIESIQIFYQGLTIAKSTPKKD